MYRSPKPEVKTKRSNVYREVSSTTRVNGASRWKSHLIPRRSVIANWQSLNSMRWSQEFDRG
jgi:hypothetical protein